MPQIKNLTLTRKQKKNPKKSDEADDKTISIGKKGSNETVKEMAVTKITLAPNLTTPSATALLQKGTLGESPESEKAAADGNELLLVSLTFKGKADGTNITPAD